MQTSTRTIGRGMAQRGATLAEFTLVIPFALLLVLGVIQLGLMFSAKSIVNEGAFMAARAGAVQNARQDKMTEAMTKALVPFYQDTTDTNDYSRLSNALSNAQHETSCNPGDPCFLKIEILNPTPEAFNDYGITTQSSAGQTFIPNDNLEYRSHDKGPSGLSIQDANVLKIKVTYGYQIKVPLMTTVLNAVMCGVDSGLDAFGRGNSPVTASGDDCSSFYSQGRIPIVSYATVQMQTPALKTN